MKTVTYSTAALASLRKHRSEARAIIAKVARYAETGAGDVGALVGRPGKRLRVGEYRVIFEESDVAIHVIALGPRGRIYE